MLDSQQSVTKEGGNQGYRRQRITHPEWPTVMIAIICYGGFAVVTTWADSIGLWLAVPVLTLLITLQSSLQHEIIHGHPFRHKHWNELLAFPPIGVYTPFERFRDIHIAHHDDRSLTIPDEDPESNYVNPAWWARQSSACRFVLTLNNTLLGRMMIGPAIGLAQMYYADLCSMGHGCKDVWRAYVFHALGLVAIAVWWTNFSSMPWWLYLISAYFAASLLKIRTFLEHCAQDHVAHRTAIVEDRGLLSLLFLKNNLHAVHHRHPGIPWYRLERAYREQRDEFLRGNNGYVYRSYWSVIRLYLLQPKDSVVHPFGE